MHIKLKPLLIISSFLLSSLNTFAQDVPSYDLIQSHLGFQISFYTEPTGSIIVDESNGYPIKHYTWESLNYDKEDSNKKYMMEVFIFPDSLSNTSTLEAFQENIFTMLLHRGGNTLRGEKSSKRVDGYSFDFYLFLDKDECTFFIQTGIVGNKLYKISYYLKDDQFGSFEGLQFSRSFRLIDPPSLVGGSVPFTPTYEITFPGEPICEAQQNEDGSMKVLVAGYVFPEEEENRESIEDIIFDETLILVEEGYTSEPVSEANKPNKNGAAERLVVYETQFPEAAAEELAANKNTIYIGMQEGMLSENGGRLISYETIYYGSNEGREMKMRGVDGQILLYHFYVINSSMYVIEVKLKSMVQDGNDEVKAFFNSFKLKE